jgi:hypothetical protein
MLKRNVAEESQGMPSTVVVRECGEEMVAVPVTTLQVLFVMG